MEELQVNARFKIKPGKMDEFKKLAHSCVENVKQKDKGTLQYDWFYNESLSEWYVRERYTNSEAVLEHVANLGDLFGRLLELADVSFGIFGNPSRELKDAIESFNVTYYEFSEGL